MTFGNMPFSLRFSHRSFATCLSLTSPPTSFSKRLTNLKTKSWCAFLKLNDPETTQVDFKTLRIITNKGSEIQILFSSEEERKTAVETILKLVPRLNP